MAENQSKHRIEMEKEVICSQQKQSAAGQWMGFIISLVGIIGGFVAIFNDHPIIGTIFAGGTLTSLVSLFILGKKQQQKDLSNKQLN